MRKAKLLGENNEDGGVEAAKGVYMIKCPGCKTSHAIAVLTPFSNGAKWGFNGDLEKPTFTPSLLVKTGKYANPQWWESLSEEDRELRYDHAYHQVCHSFITDGRIQFLGDCTHELANQTVDLPDYDNN